MQVIAFIEPPQRGIMEKILRELSQFSRRTGSSLLMKGCLLRKWGCRLHTHAQWNSWQLSHQ